MKGLLVSLLFVIVRSGNIFLGDNVGISCDKDPTYQISTFTVTPWPISIYTTYQVFMQGTFSKDEKVEAIYIGTRINQGSWSYAVEDVGKEFKKNQVANFTLTLQSFSNKAAYIIHITLHRSDYSKLSCWQYEYVVS